MSRRNPARELPPVVDAIDEEIPALREAIERLRDHAAEIGFDRAGELPPCECARCKADVRFLAAAVPALLRERAEPIHVRVEKMRDEALCDAHDALFKRPNAVEAAKAIAISDTCDTVLAMLGVKP